MRRSHFNRPRVRPVGPRVTCGSSVDRTRTRIAGLSGAIWMLLSSSYAQELPRQPPHVSPEQQVFNNACRTCHTTREGDNRLGPNLSGIIGRKAGSLPDYGYSSAMKDAGFVWDDEKLDRFIAKPDELVPGNNMKPYGGLAATEERARIIAFLKSASAGK